MRRPKSFVFRFDDVVATMWSWETLDTDKPRRFMIFCHGLPSHPYQHNPAKVEELLKLGFVLLYPNYIGTWASYGTMKWEKCIDTVLLAIEFLNGGVGTELYGNSEVKWKVRDIILVGGSFGGSVALVAGSKSHAVKKIISIAAPTNWRNHSKIEGEKEEPIEDLFYSIKRGWENLWRIPGKDEWDRLAEGSADINPVDYLAKLKEKDVFLIHGARDFVVSPKRSSDLYSKLKGGKGNHKFLLLEDAGHMGNDAVGERRIMDEILTWI